jgi:hypothetical protein
MRSTLPGFHAEAVLGCGEQPHFGTGANSTGPNDSGAVRPAMKKSCYSNCMHGGGMDVGFCICSCYGDC